MEELSKDLEQLLQDVDVDDGDYGFGKKKIKKTLFANNNVP